jgi:hypothetical protein
MRAPLAVAAALALVACRSTPTTVLLRIEAATGLPYPDELRLSVHADEGRVVGDEKLAAAALPGEVVLYPRQSSGALRILVRARSQGGPVGEGTTTAVLEAGRQVRATLVVRPGALPDADGDGVPDTIDNCPAIPNPAQGPCAGLDAGVERGELSDLRDGPATDAPAADGPGDGPRERAPDLPAPDLVPACSCSLGCVPGTSTCRSLVPSNGFTANSYTTLSGPLGDAVIETTSCELRDAASVLAKGVIVTSPAGSSTCVIGLTSLTIKNGVVVRAVGKHALALLVKQQVTVQGILDAGGHGSEPGPGGGQGGSGPAGGPGQGGAGPGGGKVCSCTGTGVDDCGGGGGGHGGAGGAGGLEGSCASPSSGGTSHGSASLIPLSAGSGGASGGQGTAGSPVAPGGAGGGALQISCGGTMTVGGAILAGGGGGQVISNGTGLGSIGGGGGGSGGGILLEAVSFAGNGVVAALGGGGGGGGGLGGATACATAGKAGEDGGPTLTPALGGASGGAPCGAGGDSGKPGAPVPGGSGGGGGGGGGGGRIRFNGYQHDAAPPLSAAAGSVTTGEVVVK